MRLPVLISLWWACSGAPTPVEAPTAPPAEGSLYDLGWTMEGASGEVRLDVYRGHPTLISMFYTSCPMACPLLIERIHGIERSLSPAARAELRVVMVSLDPEHDTRDVLSRTYEDRALDRETWTLARVDDDRVRELAAALGVPYRRSADGGFNHASVVVLLDGAGRMARRVDGADQPIDGLLADVEAMITR
ncbi:MAG TPA: SCO family protein [Myxococcota bacterium]|nr:SCO family protein [Myxococcota bacterium]